MEKYKIKSTMCVIAIILLLIVIVLFGIIIYFTELSPQAVKFDAEKLVRITTGFYMYDNNGNLIDETIPLKSAKKLSITKLPSHVKNAFIAVEDKRFYSHNGADVLRIGGAIKNNIAADRFKEGASTISQQLIKNTHLSGKKTFIRKLNEIKLARELERQYTKDQILEMYLNTIYFGNNAYGLEAAANTYFGISAYDLSIAQAAAMAGLIKAPTAYSPNNDLNKCIIRRNTVLKLMKEQNLITLNEYNISKTEEINLSIINQNKNFLKQYMHGAIQEACELLNITEKQLIESKLKIYTYYNKDIQSALCDTINNNIVKTVNGNIAQCCGMVANNESSGIEAFAGISKNNLYTIRRNIGSAAKPLVSFAPALNERIITPLTIIEDAPCSFDGYSPHNYNDKYYGYVTMRDAVAKSLNSVAINLLNNISIKKGYEYLIKNGFTLSKNDNGLPIALGAFTFGITLKELTQGYMTLANKGEFSNLHFIKSISDESGRTLYKTKIKYSRVFDDDSAFLMTDMLTSVVNNGTAKGLKSDNLNFSIAAKTGTVGEIKSKDNTDALLVSYNTKHTTSMWIGGYINDTLPSTVTGGNLPVLLTKQLYLSIYKNNKPKNFEIPESVTKLSIDKKTLFDTHIAIKSIIDTPNDQIISEYFSIHNCPQSTIKPEKPSAFLNLNLSLNNDGFPVIEFESAENIKVSIYRKNNTIDKLIATVDGGNVTYIDNNVELNKSYTYYILPISDEFKGVKSQEKTIKTLQKKVDEKQPPNEDWWRWIYKIIQN
ncbi:MAG: transglycosylase domain-containing protein [Clostridia bacterium]